jgi:hypothetical protein
LNDLFDRVKKIVDSLRNQINKKFWHTAILWPRDMWRGFPEIKPSQNAGIPFLVFPGNVMWAKILGIDLRGG